MTIRGAEAPAQNMEAPLGLTAESALADFHELRQGFSPPKSAQSNIPKQLQTKKINANLLARGAS